MQRDRYQVDQSACAVLVEAWSRLGEFSFGSSAITGTIELVRDGDRVDTRRQPSARLTASMLSLTAGNALYDAELHRRLEVHRFPYARIDMTAAEPEDDNSYAVAATVDLHGVSSTLRGRVALDFPDPDTVRITGEQTIDIRDFGIELPSVLMLRVYPQVKVSLHLLARRVP